MKLAKRISRSSTILTHTVALITDFGLSDQYVGTLKGVILSINPYVQIVDIVHTIRPQKIQQAGYILWTSYRYFPKNTYFLNIVDPGVGTNRKILIMRTKEYTFLAPDNGLLDFIYQDENIIESIEVIEKMIQPYILKNGSLTFQGRDILAPLTAHLTKGIRLKEIGIPYSPRKINSTFYTSRSDTTHPCILHIDHFGNIITNLSSNKSKQLLKEMQAISIGRNLVSRWIQSYEEAPENTPCLIVGSSGLVEISVKNNSAAQILNVTFDSPIKVYWR
jgi:S-adenosylmethionine hydrolase